MTMDDGMDEDTRPAAATGHFGLPGMRERAAIVGDDSMSAARLASAREIELRIPAAIAYGAAAHAAWWSRLAGCHVQTRPRRVRPRPTTGHSIAYARFGSHRLERG